MNLVPVLLYHSVSRDPHPLISAYAVTEPAFAEHLDLVVERGLETVTVSELVQALDAGDRDRLARMVAITFDDGFADVASAALPALESRGMRATLYVTTGVLRGGRGRPLDADLATHMLDWSQLADLRTAGVEIGAHSHSHPQLDTLRAPRVHEEVHRPRALLEDALGETVPSFAYPHGFSSSEVRRLVREAGYASACAVGQTFTSPADDRLALSRLMLTAETTAADVGRWLDRRGAPAPRTHELVRTRAWRAYRRGRATVTGRAGADPAWPAARLPR